MGLLGILGESYILVLIQFYTTFTHPNNIPKLEPKLLPLLSKLSLYSTSVNEALKLEEEDQIPKFSTPVCDSSLC